MPKIERRAKKVVESTVQDQIVKALSQMPDVVIHRNLVGTYETVRAGWIKAGLGEGTADLVGWLSVPIGPSPGYPFGPSAGCRVARFLALEVKRPGGDNEHKAHEAEQRAWLELVRLRGGVAGIVHSAAEAVDLIEKARRWEC